jgi:hypothetical protein
MKIKDYVEQHPFETFSMTPEQERVRYYTNLWAKEGDKEGGEVEATKSYDHYQESSQPF